MNRKESELGERARGSTYHHVAVDILDYKIANIHDRGVATVFIQGPGLTFILLCCSRFDRGNQTLICIVDVVCVAGEL